MGLLSGAAEHVLETTEGKGKKAITQQLLNLLQ